MIMLRSSNRRRLATAVAAATALLVTTAYDVTAKKSKGKTSTGSDEDSPGDGQPAEEQTKYKCAGFQQTAKCNPEGKKEKSLLCHQDVDAGSSGYCLCTPQGGGAPVALRKENCNHSKFNCDNTCRR